MKKFIAYTLIEVLMAIFILEIGLLGIFAFYSYSLNITKMAKNQTIAANLGSGLLDEQIAKTFDLIPVGAGSKDRYSTDATSPFYEWYKTIDVYYINSDLANQVDPTDMKKIIVTVYWYERNEEKKLEIASIKANH